MSIPRAAENVDACVRPEKEEKRKKRGGKKKRKKMAKYLSESLKWYFGAVNKGHRFRF